MNKQGSADALIGEKRSSAEMFGRIHRKYDILNHLLTLGLDRRWRKRTAVRIAQKFGPADAPEILDLATGTGDMAIALRKRIRTAGMTIADPSAEMMTRALQKLARKECCVRNSIEDAGNLSFRDASFDVISIAFGVRNFPAPEVALSECQRVLKPGGTIWILEFGWPPNPIVALLYRVYSGTVIPLLGWLVARDSLAYRYLTRTIRSFPYGRDFTGLLERSGFENASYSKFSAGIVYLYRAQKG